jgi:hypothetical protein
MLKGSAERQVKRLKTEDHKFAECPFGLQSKLLTEIS